MRSWISQKHLTACIINPAKEAKQFGVSDKALNLFDSYMSDRKQFARIGSTVSEVLSIAPLSIIFTIIAVYLYKLPLKSSTFIKF